jgi:flap endonuclease-1
MGIKDLYPYLKKTIPDTIIDVPISCFFGKKIAVDVSVYLYKYICMENQNKANWLDLFISTIVWFRKNNVRLIFIFDGVAPVEKSNTQTMRRDTREKYNDNLKYYSSLLEKLEQINNITDISIDLKEDINKLFNEKNIKCIYNYKNILLEIKELYYKERGKIISITKEHIQLLKELLNILGIPWYIAVGEAEKSCSWLCKNGYVDSVLTNDSDVLAYRCPMYIKNISNYNNTLSIVHYNHILDGLNINNEQFLDFCILCGTDYNNRLSGIGPAKAMVLIKKYGSLDELNKIYNISSLNYPLIRKLFILPDSIEDILMEQVSPFKIKRYRNIDKILLESFLYKNNCKYSINDIIKNTFKGSFEIQD